MVIANEMRRDYCKFMNFLMGEVYNVFFRKRLPRVLPDMKEMLQFSPQRRIGYWFLFEYGIVIRLYGFVHQPYIPPSFLTMSVCIGTNQEKVNS